MANELEELLAFHNRVLRQCWQAYGRLDQAYQVTGHARALQAAGEQLHRIFDAHAEHISPEVRREAVRTMARVECFLRAMREQGNTAPGSPQALP